MRRTRSVVALLAIGAALVAATSPVAGADDGWHANQPLPPSGTGIGVPVPLGAVGDIAFWAPNRGLLTTAGNGGVPAGLYAYDGTGWHQISTVCGGHDGRIAWAGPNEWWTIADQPTGQIVVGNPTQQWHRSLCHFVDGRVVASYAEPIGTSSSYLPLNAAVCNGPSDCWFGGDRLPGTTNVGAFHLHWDGQSLTPVPSLSTPEPQLGDPPRTVADLVAHQGQLYESVQVQQDDPPIASELSDHPALLHTIDSASSSPFTGLIPSLEYEPGVQAWDLSALRLASDGDQLWAIAGKAAESDASPHVLAQRLGGDGQFTQVCAPPAVPGDACALDDPAGALAPGTTVAGVAADPGTDAAWIAYAAPGDDSGPTPPARLARLHADGTVEPPATLPTPADGIARKGSAGPIACPSAGQCWMATTQGWLFHLGSALPQDTDPVLHRLITFRPPDDSIPFVPPDTLPIDDSGADLGPESASPTDNDPSLTQTRRAKPLVFGIRRRMAHGGTTLVLTFGLRARARVQLVALRRGRPVARTARRTLARGRHTLRLRLDPRRWPTKLDLRTHRVRAKRAL